MADTNDQPGGESTGLLDTATVEDPNTPAEPQKAEIPHQAPDPAAAAAAPAAAPEAPPEWMPENFLKDGKPDYEAMAKSWRDLRGKISKGAHNAPADGKYNLAAFGEKGDDHPIGQTLASWAKENGISAAAFEELTTKISTQANEIMGQDMVDPKQEMAKLGPNANAVVNGMVDWARGLVNKGVWSKDDFDEFKIMGGTARGLQALLKIREAYEGRVPIESTPMDGAPSKDELYQMVADPKYKTDAAYRQKVERLFAKTLG
jgi:hypothetical protein